MKTVLVTGGSGFVGGHIIRQLSERGHRVFATMHRTALSDHVRAHCESVIRTDPSDPRNFLSTLRHCDAVIHAAAYIPNEMTDLGQARACMEANAFNVMNLANAAREADVGRFIYLSSAQVYARGKNVVCANPRTEDSTTRAGVHGAAYLTSKLVGETLVETTLEGHGATVILRLGAVYGPGSDKGAIGHFVAQATRGEAITVYGEGAARFTPVWVGDVADLAERATMTGHGIYNVVGDEHVSVIEAAWAVKDMTERVRPGTRIAVMMRPNQPVGPTFPPISNRKARAGWGFRFTPVAEGLALWLTPQTVMDNPCSS